MDFSTRNLYRSAIEELARLDRTEIEIARRSVATSKPHMRARWKAAAILAIIFSGGRAV
jgi:hypothetical protein